MFQRHDLDWDPCTGQARKPEFWANSQSLYEVVSDDGLMRPVMTAHKGGLYCGGSAVMVERALQLEGDDILYVGDHIYTGDEHAILDDGRDHLAACAVSAILFNILSMKARKKRHCAQTLRLQSSISGGALH